MYNHSVSNNVIMKIFNRYKYQLIRTKFYVVRNTLIIVIYRTLEDIGEDQYDKD